MNDKQELNEKKYILEAHKTVLQQQPSIDSIAQIPGSDTDQLFENEKRKQTGLGYASFNYINSIIGSGVIGIPFAFQQAGFGLGLVLLAVVALVTDYSLRLMVRSAHICGSFSYSGIMAAAFGSTGFFLLSALQFVYPFIAMVSYNVVVGDTVTKVLVRMFGLSSTALLARRDFVVLLCTLSVTVPLCLQKDMARLARASMVSIFFVFFILFTITLRFFTLFGVVPPTEDAFEFSNSGVIPAIGIMAFAFMCHHNVFLLYASIEEATQEKWDKVTHYSVFASFLVTVVFGLVGYTTFTGYVQGDLLENFCWDDDLMNLSRVVFSATILLTFPIECLVTRAVVEAVWGHLETARAHRGVTLAIVMAAYLVSVSTDCLGIVLELNGVLAAVPLAFVLPAATYLKLCPGSVLSKDQLPALGVVVFGLCVALTGLYLIITQFGSVGSCTHGNLMWYCQTNSTSHS
ncbi:putative sodium-coupled neutral amino acid transporter 11 [Macrosteles quadrilineatus]|uniref:putative sodium-coupled neutral amino acid transporter 11 n=1 Tax=Macrosteles quadrilineatus TaxID=74068 RepID=UPI0023E2F0D3|nr:putative sodium-coupled neutral amino acid transporter 11 [Macrosteles quadrilineatus]